MDHPTTPTPRAPDPDFWRHRRVLVTGHSGFKGAWLAAWLCRLGAEVAGFALPPDTIPHLPTDAAIADLGGDIRDAAALAAAMGRFAPEIVLHLAAQPLVRRAYSDPIETFAANVMGTANLLQAARTNAALRAIVVVTSDKCYDNPPGRPAHPFAEQARLGGHDPYSASKACAELVAASFRASYGLPVATVRAGNVIGGGDWSPDRLVPDCIRALVARQPVVLRHPAATRPWQHVLDPLAGYLLLAERLAEDPGFAQAYNFGPPADDIRPVAAVVGALAACWGDGARWTQADGHHPHEAPTLAIDAAKARARLGWRPRLPLDQAIAWTAGWYKSHQNGADPGRLIDRQLTAYEALDA